MNNPFVDLSKNLKSTIKELMVAVKVEALSNFDMNFAYQGFFGAKWKESSHVNKENDKVGKNRFVLQKSGTLRRSIRGVISGTTIRFYSDVPYAKAHNDGFEGTVSVRAHDRKKYRKSFIHVSKRIHKWVKESTGEVSAVKSHSRKMNVPQRQFLGAHPALEHNVRRVIENKLRNVFRN